MSAIAPVHRTKRLRRYGLVLALALAAPVTHALEVTLTAEYRGGGSGQFENTTPPAHNCRLFQALCIKGKTVDIPITYSKPVTKRTGDVRDLLYLKTPGRREIDVYHDQTGEPHRLAFEVVGLSLKAVSGYYWYNPLSNGSAVGGCSRMGGLGLEGERSYTRGLRISEPASPSPCWQVSPSAPTEHVEPVSISQLAIAYTLQMPPSYRLKPGIYRGSVTYSVGANGDFDFGNQVSDLNTNTLTLSFVLDVEHAFIFDFPPGSDRAVLEPAGGWVAWPNGGRVPGRLYRDLPMRVWSTGPIKVYKLCEHDAGTHCAIRNDLGENVPVQVSLSLPEGIRYRGGRVDRLALPSGRAAALQFESVIPTINRPGELHFEVAREDVRPMLDRAGKTYNGKVTVVFDAEI
ncbi:hypothetical protein PS627_02498 [Pseudomonas fluorescens]|uniref:hypothetical protein n=1 Tax=Pseudomonas fluorescens TaxID=294 RepID=UPI0012587738|nr:hypothetical protein [Pseudomonas fluorescens]CAG8867455.1 hypothetical protein PS627_02498 [Pseudomonas fluorescens]